MLPPEQREAVDNLMAEAQQVADILMRTCAQRSAELEDEGFSHLTIIAGAGIFGTALVETFNQMRANGMQVPPA